MVDIDHEVWLTGTEIMWMTGRCGYNYSLVKLESCVGYVLMREDLIIGAYNDEAQAIADYHVFDPDLED